MPRVCNCDEMHVFSCYFCEMHGGRFSALEGKQADLTARRALRVACSNMLVGVLYAVGFWSVGQTCCRVLADDSFVLRSRCVVGLWKFRFELFVSH